MNVSRWQFRRIQEISTHFHNKYRKLGHIKYQNTFIIIDKGEFFLPIDSKHVILSEFKGS